MIATHCRLETGLTVQESFRKLELRVLSDCVCFLHISIGVDHEAALTAHLQGRFRWRTDAVVILSARQD
jgi:hypothetical protein